MAQQRRHPDPFDFTTLTRLTEFRRRVLMLDYDGTLAPFRNARMEAVPYPGVREALSRLSQVGSTLLAIVSGRSTHEIETLIGSSIPVEIWGAHGWERRYPDGRHERWPLSDRESEALETALTALADHVSDEFLERKAGSVAVHTRPLTESDRCAVEELVRRRWSGFAEDATLQLRPFDGGYELRAVSRTKATVVETFRAEQAAGKTTLFAYLGDDETDEDAFAAMSADDWSVLVRKDARPTHARFWLAPPDDLLRFIDGWTAAIR